MWNCFVFPRWRCHKGNFNPDILTNLTMDIPKCVVCTSPFEKREDGRGYAFYTVFFSGRICRYRPKWQACKALHLKGLNIWKLLETSDKMLPFHFTASLVSFFSLSPVGYKVIKWKTYGIKNAVTLLNQHVFFQILQTCGVIQTQKDNKFPFSSCTRLQWGIQ